MAHWKFTQALLTEDTSGDCYCMSVHADGRGKKAGKEEQTRAVFPALCRVKKS